MVQRPVADVYPGDLYEILQGWILQARVRARLQSIQALELMPKFESLHSHWPDPASVMGIIPAPASLGRITMRIKQSVIS